MTYVARRALTYVTLAAAATLVLVGIGLPLVGVRVFAGTDRLLIHAPWQAQAPTGFDPTNICTGDTIDSVIPQHHEFDRQLDNGRYGSWNPYSSGGSRLASTPDPAVFTPAAWPYLFLPIWLAPGYAKLVEMVVAIGGMFLFLRRLTLSPPAALLGGVAFASSGFMVAWTNWPQTQVAAWIPALFWAVERFVQLRTARAAVPVGLVVAAMLLGGFPAVTGWALYAAGAYFLLRLGWEGRQAPRRLLRGSVLAGVGLVGGIALVGAQLLPFATAIGNMDLSYRAQTAATHLPLLGLMTAFVPFAFGSCAHGPGFYFGPDRVSEIELLSYAGAAVLVLAGVGLLRRPARGVPFGVRGFLVVATAVLLVLAYVGGPLLGLAQHLPVFSNNFVGRIRSLLGFTIAALAAVGFDRLVRRPDTPRARWAVWLEVTAWLGAAAAMWVAVQHLRATGRDVHHLSWVDHQLVLPLVGAAIVLGVVVASGYLHGTRRTVVLSLVPVVVLAQAMAVVLPFWPRIPRSQFYPVTATHRFLQAHLGHERFATVGLAMEPGSSTYYGLRSATGHAFTEEGWRNLLLTAGGPHTFPSPTYSTLPSDVGLDRLSSPILDLLAVRYVVRDPADPLVGSRTEVGGSGATTVLQPGRSVEVPLPAGPLRGVGPVLAAAVRTRAPYAAVRVDALDATGTVLASNSRRLYATEPAGPFVVAVGGEPAGAVRARITLTNAQVPLQLESGPAGVHAVTVTDPGDPLRLAFAGGAVVYERASAYPRFRWASTTTVVPDLKQRLTLLANTRDPNRVVLSAPGPAAAGKPATVHVRQDAPESLRATVDAQGSGYLVVADALQDSPWRATVDGRDVPLRAADEGLVAVQVPAGRHEVHLYDSRHRMWQGLAASAAGVVVLAALWLTGSEWYRRRRRVRP